MQKSVRPDPITPLRGGRSSLISEADAPGLPEDCPPDGPSSPRQRELWTETFLSKADWSYAEAVAWIKFQEGVGAAEALGFEESGLAPDHAEILWRVLATTGDSVAEAEPQAALFQKLNAGEVEALHLWRSRTGQIHRVLISRELAQRLVLRIVSPEGVAFRDRLVPIDDPDGLYVNVRFDRASVMEKFPQVVRQSVAAVGKPGRPPQALQRALDYLAKTYPDGRPPNASTKGDARNANVSPDTISRAIKTFSRLT